MNTKLQMPDVDALARKWHALAERRRQHFEYLHSSGRWRKYYHEYNFLTQMRETTRMAEAWTKVARSAGAAPA